VPIGTPMIVGSPLRPADLAQFERLSIPKELLESAGVCRVTDKEARDVLGVNRPGDMSGVLFPGLHPETGQTRNYRVRRDQPEMENGKPKNKYMSSVDPPTLYFPPGCGAQLMDASIPVVFIEPEKGALALWAAASRTGRRVLPVATRGCWNFRGRTGKTTDANGSRVDETGVLPDMDRLAWGARDVVVLSDANVATNTSVQAAGRALAKALGDRGAKVRVTAVPVEEGINGPDDYIGRHGDEALFRLLDTARRIEPTPKKENPTKSKQGRGLPFEDPEPWPDPVDGSALLDAVSATFSRYLALPAHAATTLAL
jgi:Domain of unknown function (DUF3854)